MYVQTTTESITELDSPRNAAMAKSESCRPAANWTPTSTLFPLAMGLDDNMENFQTITTSGKLAEMICQFQPKLLEVF